MEEKPHEKSKLEKFGETTAASAAHVAEKVIAAKGKEKNAVLAATAYALFFVPLLTKEKHDPFVQFHVQQAFGLFLFALMVQGAVSFLLGLGIGPWQFLVWPAGLFLIFEFLEGAVRAYRGEKKQLPFIGKYAARLYEIKK